MLSKKMKTIRFLIKLNNTIEKVATDIFQRQSYNTAIAAIMEFLIV